jgi:hypothetical protein
MLVQPYIDTLIGLAPKICHKTAVLLDFIIYPEASELAFKVQSDLVEAGFPVFRSVGRAAAALNSFTRYYEGLDSGNR